MSYEDYKRECEAVSIEVKRYRVDGLPACASWYGDKKHGREMCQFLGSKRFGTTDVCMATGESILACYPGEDIKTPCLDCTVWSYEKEVKPLIDRLRIQVATNK